MPCHRRCLHGCGQIRGRERVRPARDGLELPHEARAGKHQQQRRVVLLGRGRKSGYHATDELGVLLQPRERPQPAQKDIRHLEADEGHDVRVSLGYDEVAHDETDVAITKIPFAM